MAVDVKRRRLAIIGAIMTLAVIVSYAGIVVFNPLKLSINYQEAPVQFTLGDNANQLGLEGQQITVTISADGTWASISFAMPNGTVYLVDPLRIENQGTKTYYVKLYINTTSNSDLNKFSEAKAYLVNPSDYSSVVYTFDLKNNQGSVNYISLSSGYSYALIFKFVPAPDQWTTGSTATLQLGLMYSNSTADLISINP